MTKYPDPAPGPNDGSGGGDNRDSGEPSRYWLAIVVIVALFILSLALLAHAT